MFRPQKIRLGTITAALFCGLLASGCSSVGSDFSAGAPQVVAAPDNVSAMLAEAADRASTALETLAAVEYSRTPTPSIAPVNGAPTELRRAVTVNWVGPVEPIAQTLADRAGYKFDIVGSMPSIPIVISLDVENKPVIDVLRDIGLQLGQRGDVKVDSVRRVVEINYPPTARGL